MSEDLRRAKPSLTQGSTQQSPSVAPAGGLSKFAYADPPYVGHMKRGRYKHDPLSAEVDHAALIRELELGGYAGWALSCSSPSLRGILPLCPPTVRVMAWVKPFCSFKPGVNPAYAWEPIIVQGGRRRERSETTVRDWVAANIVLQKGLCGAKPPEFCRWLFDVLGMRPGDNLVDLFPGTGAVSDAWTAVDHRGLDGPGDGELPAKEAP